MAKMPRQPPDENEKLIRLVKKYPVLYDASLTKKTSKMDKDAVWKKVAAKFKGRDDSRAIAEVKNRWRNIRDSYVKYTKYRMALALANDSPGNRKPWKYCKTLTFLTPHLRIKPLKKEEDEIPEKEVTPEREIENIEKEKFMETFNLNPVDHPIVQTNQTVMGSFLATPSPSFRSDLYIDNNNMHQTKENGIDLFFRGITDTVKSMNPMNQVKAQKEIANLVFDIRIRECQEGNRRFNMM